MQISTLAAALVIFLLLSDSEVIGSRYPGRYSGGSWGRRRPVRYSRRFIGKYPRRFRRVMYKRDADDPCPPTEDDDDDDGGMSQETAVKLLKKLSLECPRFAIDPSVGLSKEVVVQAFDAVDDDRDDNLNGKELDEFEEVLDAFEVCAEQAAGSKN